MRPRQSAPHSEVDSHTPKAPPPQQILGCLLPLLPAPEPSPRQETNLGLISTIRDEVCSLCSTACCFKCWLFLGIKAITNLNSVLKAHAYFTNKDPSSQGYGFSSSHVCM